MTENIVKGYAGKDSEEWQYDADDDNYEDDVCTCKLPLS